MRLNLIGPFTVNAPFGTEIAFAKGLRRMGHEVVEVDPNICGELPDPRADATVVFKSCVGREEEMLRHLSHPIVVYQPDDARFPHIRRMIRQMGQYSDLLLSFDDHGADVAMQYGYRAAETLLLTADDELYCPPPAPIERDIDVSFIGSLGDPVAHASRRRMCEIVQTEADRRGWKTCFGTTQHVPTIVDVYRRSKVVLNHATDVGQRFGTGFGLQCRHFEVGMTGTPLVSNSLLNRQYGLLSIPFISFDDERSLIESIEVCHDNVAVFSDLMFTAMQKEHLPQFRAAQLIDFIQRNA